MTAMSLPTPIGRQREVLYLPAQGHVVVLGTAGSGKTTLAILRSLYLADQSTDHGGRTLLVTFNRCLVTYMNHLALDGEQQRSVKEGLKEHELALFDLLTKDELAKAERERVKQASRELLASTRTIRASVRKLAELRIRGDSRCGSATARTEVEAHDRMGCCVRDPLAVIDGV